MNIIRKNTKKLNRRDIEIIFDDGGSITFEPLAALEICYAICDEFDLDDTQFQELENKLLEELENDSK